MDILNRIKNSDTKVKFLGVIVIVLILIIIMVIIGRTSSNSNNENYNNNNYYQDDDFGNNEEVTAVEKEDVVATTPDIEVVILSEKFGGGSWGYIELTKAYASVDVSLDVVLINVEGIKGNPGEEGWSPAIPYRVYDANDTLLWSNDVYVDNYENKEQGDICKGSTPTYLKPEQVARIEIG
ncbi:MAG: hypothetical protein IKC45_00720 [Clostridia bacterium]|nr:hypothetical protein [Clostridia bacterium]